MNNIGTLSDRAALWKLKVSKLTIYKRDKKATQLVTDANEGRKAGNFNKKLFEDCSAVERTLAAYGAVYEFWFSRTAPYLDYQGERLIDSRILIDTMREFGDLKAEAESQLAGLRVVWDRCVTDDIARLKEFGCPSDYPDDPYPFFGIDSQMRPVPSVNGFQFDIPEDEKRKLVEQQEEAAKLAQAYAVQTLIEPIQAFCKRANEYKGEKGERWHDTIVTNIQDVVAQVKSLNIMGDPKIDAFINEVENYWRPIAFNPSVIKESVAHRDDARAKLEEITKRMSAYAGSL